MFGYLKRKRREKRIKFFDRHIKITKEIELLYGMVTLKSFFIRGWLSDFKKDFKSLKIEEGEDVIKKLKDYELRFDKEVKDGDLVRIKNSLHRFFPFIEYFVKLDPLFLKENLKEDYQPKELKDIINSNPYVEDKNMKIDLITVKGMVDEVIFKELKDLYFFLYREINYGSEYNYLKKPKYSFEDRLTLDEIIEGKKYVGYELEKEKL